MKKIIYSLVFAFMFGSALALTTVNVDEHHFTCNKIKITSATTESAIQANCKHVKTYHRMNGTAGRNPARTTGGGANITQKTNPDVQLQLEKVRFYDDEEQELICYFQEQKIEKCKVQLKPKPKVEVHGLIEKSIKEL